VETVFKALSDPHRRALLDLLHDRDGQTLAQLDAHLPMTRFGTMKHLRLLEAAGLVATRKVGREKLHFLNPVPIRLIHDRWIDKYTEPAIGAMARLKRDMEGGSMSGPKHVYEVYIRTTPAQLWKAITDPGFTKRYFYETAVETDWKAGSPYVYRSGDGAKSLEGKIVEIEPMRRIVMTFTAVHDAEQAKERPSRVTWEIEPHGATCKLTLVHDDFDGETATYRSVGSGWNLILSGLKTLLETGEPLVVGA
jgi:uncharacterized protein YndB with AHSA1/START domain/DNA-binding transcriptional ArsR family regulator